MITPLYAKAVIDDLGNVLFINAFGTLQKDFTDSCYSITKEKVEERIADYKRNNPLVYIFDVTITKEQK